MEVCQELEHHLWHRGKSQNAELPHLTVFLEIIINENSINSLPKLTRKHLSHDWILE